MPIDCDCVGDGGGSTASTKLGRAVCMAGGCDSGWDDSVEVRCAFEEADIALVEDLIDALSDLSTAPLLASAPTGALNVEFLGFSDFALPGIFDRNEFLMDREDSLVSDLLNDG